MVGRLSDPVLDYAQLLTKASLLWYIQVVQIHSTIIIEQEELEFL